MAILWETERELERITVSTNGDSEGIGNNSGSIGQISDGVNYE